MVGTSTPSFWTDLLQECFKCFGSIDLEKYLRASCDYERDNFRLCRWVWSDIRGFSCAQGSFLLKYFLFFYESKAICPWLARFWRLPDILCTVMNLFAAFNSSNDNLQESLLLLALKMANIFEVSGYVLIYRLLSNFGRSFLMFFPWKQELSCSLSLASWRYDWIQLVLSDKSEERYLKCFFLFHNQQCSDSFL